MSPRSALVNVILDLQFLDFFIRRKLVRIFSTKLRARKSFKVNSPAHYWIRFLQKCQVHLFVPFKSDGIVGECDMAVDEIFQIWSVMIWFLFVHKIHKIKLWINSLNYTKELFDFFITGSIKSLEKVTFQ